MPIFNRTNLLLCSLGLAIGSAYAPAQACGDCSHSHSQTRILQNPVEVAPLAAPELTTGTSQAVARSDFEARLAHLLDQVNLGAQRGWLTPQQAAGFQQWQAQVLQAEAAMRVADGGILSPASNDQMERFVNSLALSVNAGLNKHALLAP